jgi:nitrous oxidase accessory protein NosD
MGWKAWTTMRLNIALLLVSILAVGIAFAATDFAGTVLMVDQVANKLSVKKDEGGTRFTFVINEKTQFEGANLKSLKDVQKGDSVTVQYQVVGSQYVAEKVIARKK